MLAGTQVAGGSENSYHPPPLDIAPGPGNLAPLQGGDDDRMVRSRWQYNPPSLSPPLSRTFLLTTPPNTHSFRVATTTHHHGDPQVHAARRPGPGRAAGPRRRPRRQAHGRQQDQPHLLRADARGTFPLPLSASKPHLTPGHRTSTTRATAASTPNSSATAPSNPR